MSALVEINRLFGFDDLVAHYGGPASLWEKLRPLLPVFTTHDGEPIFLESAVDDFLKFVRERLQFATPGCAGPNWGPAVQCGEERPDYMTVAEAQRRFLGGMRSRRWWYRMAETGKTAHHRVGDSILFRPEDIEKFIAESRQGERHVAEDADEPSPAPVPPPVQPRAKNRPGEDPSRFRFCNRSF